MTNSLCKPIHLTQMQEELYIMQSVIIYKEKWMKTIKDNSETELAKVPNPPYPSPDPFWTLCLIGR